MQLIFCVLEGVCIHAMKILTGEKGGGEFKMNYFYDSKQFWLSIAAINIWQIKQHEFMYTKHIK